jgi:hypothetical protein
MLLLSSEAWDGSKKCQGDCATVSARKPRGAVSASHCVTGSFYHVASVIRSLILTDRLAFVGSL